MSMTTNHLKMEADPVPELQHVSNI